ncbi:hypothetical protein THOB06_40161 [Vibrio rotiferianus]|nr:hypothetical protein THOG10_40162 [Vibrio rotiferianus]CAH1588952.1 hypothetical protein THOB06_40161 [Vibrio rotiferianus]
MPHLKRFYLEQNLTAKDQQTLISNILPMQFWIELQLMSILTIRRKSASF